jgi:hypothetical protein
LAIIHVKVIPNARKSEIEGWQGETLRVRLHAPPEKGKANDELISLLSKEYGVKKSSIEILSGHTSRIKRVKIEGINIK